jgi:probable HAF family extracellular repeat protein
MLKTIAATLLALGMAGETFAGPYTFTPLGRLSLGGGNNSAFSINNSGQIVGMSNDRPVMWNGATAIPLSMPEGNLYGVATKINDSGRIVGYVNTGVYSQPMSAVFWENTSTTILSKTSGSTWAMGINSTGTIVGQATMANDATYHAASWAGPSIIDLGTLGGTYSAAYAINSNGQIVGYSYTSGDTARHATLWHGNAIVDLGTLSGSSSDGSDAYDINDNGQVVGNSMNTSRRTVATLWEGGEIINLGTLGSTKDVFSYATAINSKGQIVGSSYMGSVMHATLWTDRTPIDLNDYLDENAKSAGWVLWYARDINDSGWIVGDAYNATGDQYAYLLYPSSVPEPKTLFMIALGLGVSCLYKREKG